MIFEDKVTECMWNSQRLSHFRHDFLCNSSHFRHDFLRNSSHFSLDIRMAIGLVGGQVAIRPDLR